MNARDDETATLPGMTAMAQTETATSWRGGLDFAKGAEIKEGLLRISSLLDDMDAYLSFVRGLDVFGRADLRLVCDEIGSNLVRYSSPTHDVRLDIELQAELDRVELRLTDNGEEFNPFTAGIPYMGDDLEKRRLGGLGLYLVAQLFPLAEYRRADDRNISILVYYLGPDGWKKMRRAGER